jgi:hypothetical protein
MKNIIELGGGGYTVDRDRSKKTVIKDDNPLPYYFSYDDIHLTVQKLAKKILADKFEFDIIVAIGTGGFIPARILKTYIDKPILAVAISYYGPDNKHTDTPQTVQWIDEVEKKLDGKRILLVDEVDDSRTTLEYCIQRLLLNGVKEIGVAVLHNKRKEKQGKIPEVVQRYYVGHQLEDRWVYYPWDAKDIKRHVAGCNVYTQPSTPTYHQGRGHGHIS